MQKTNKVMSCFPLLFLPAFYKKRSLSVTPYHQTRYLHVDVAKKVVPYEDTPFYTDEQSSSTLNHNDERCIESLSHIEEKKK